MKKLLLLCLISGAAMLAQKTPGAKPAPAAPAKPKVSAFNKTVFEAYVRHLFVWGPPIQVQIDDPKPGPMPGFDEVSVHASQGNASSSETFFISKDGQKIIRGQFFDVAKNPFKSDLDKLKTDFRPSIGTPGASVVIVAFSDFQCHYCKEEAKVLRDNLLKEYPTQVRLYFMDNPLDSVHPWARAAANAGQCIFKQKPALFWEYHDWIFEHQEEMTPENLQSKILEFAKGKDLDALSLGRCMDTKANDAEITKTLEQGRAVGVSSTPTIFVNGRRMVGAVDWPSLKRVIDYEIDYQKTAKNAGEDCGCDTTLPTPGFK
jgi:protein-disulfide isomerase